MGNSLLVVAVVLRGSQASVVRGFTDFRVGEDSPSGCASQNGYRNHNTSDSVVLLARLFLSLGALHVVSRFNPRAQLRLGRLVASEKSRAALLNDEIVAANSSEIILTMVRQNHEHMNAVNLATAYQRLALVSKYDRAAVDAISGDSRFDLLIDAVARHKPEKMDASVVAMLLWSFAILDHFPAKTYSSILRAFKRHLQRGTFEAHHISKSVWALGRLEKKPTKFIPQIQQRAIEKLNNMDIVNCANLIWGFGKFCEQPKILLAKLSVMMLSRGMLNAALPVDIADIAFGLAYASNPGESDVLLLAIAMRATVVIDAFTSRQLVTLVFAFSRLRAIDLLVDGEFDIWLDAIKNCTRDRPLSRLDDDMFKRSMGDIGMLSRYVEVRDWHQRREEVVEEKCDSVSLRRRWGLL